MSTKSMPGKFNCYAAALPDEPIFTVLGRDPAAPATIEFWVQERARLKKVDTRDDIDRLSEAGREADSFRSWRRENLNPFGDGPTWKLPRQIETDDRPIRVEDPAMDISVKDVIESVIHDMNLMTEISGWSITPLTRPRIRGLAQKLRAIVEAIDANVPCIPTAQDVDDGSSQESLRDKVLSLVEAFDKETAKNVMRILGYMSLCDMVADAPQLSRNTAAIDAALACVQPEPSMKDDDEPETPLIEALEAITVIAKQPEIKYDEWLKLNRIADVLLRQARQGAIAHQPMTQEFTAGFFRFGEETYTYERLAEIVRTFNQGIADKMPSNWHNPQDLKDIDNHSEVRRKIGCGIRQVAEDVRRFALDRKVGRWLTDVMLEWTDRINGHAAELDGGYTPGGTLKTFTDVQLGEIYQPIVSDPPYEFGQTVTPEGEPERFEGTVMQTLGKIDNLKPGEKIIVDSAPEDLAHAPEVPQHRFSEFRKGKHYAYARGLEISPSHLPTALDAMQRDGWELVSLFGQTKSEHVGFVFKRTPPAAYFIPGEDGFGFDPDTLRKIMTETPEFDSAKSYTKLDLRLDTIDAQNQIAKVRAAVDRFKDTTTLPKVEVHVEGLGAAEATDILRQVECRLGWLRTDAEKLRVVGLIANDPQAAFDFTQADGQITRRSTLTNGDCGDMEFGRQQEP